MTYKDLTVGFIQTGSEGGWRAANTASFKDTALELGINLKFYDAQNKLENQISAFRNFIADKDVDVIILAALEAAGWDQVLQEAKAAGKTVVIQDRRIDSDPSLYATYIGSDFVEEGRNSAIEMCKLLEGSTSKNVVELVGNVGSSPAIDRGKGFREKMADCGITVTKSQTGELERHRRQGRHGGVPQGQQGHPGRVRPERRDGSRRRACPQGRRDQARRGRQDRHRRRHQGRLRGDDRRHDQRRPSSATRCSPRRSTRPPSRRPTARICRSGCPRSRAIFRQETAAADLPARKY